MTTTAEGHVGGSEHGENYFLEDDALRRALPFDPAATTDSAAFRHENPAPRERGSGV